MRYFGNRLALISFLALSLGAGCQRSPQFKADSDFTRDEGSDYYGASGRDGTARIAAVGQPKKRVVVLDFWNDTPSKQAELGPFAADELRRGLYLTGRVILPPELKSELTTEDLVQGQKVKTAQLIREGKRLGVSILVIGRITKSIFRQRGDEIGLLRQRQSLAATDIEIKVYDVPANREIAAFARAGESASNTMVALESGDIESPAYRAELAKLAARDAVAKLVPDVVRVVEKLSWQGRIAKLAGTKIYVNAGRSSGLVAGDILKVLSPGDDIYDPSTGAYLGRSSGQVKGTVEVADFIGPDAAVAEIHTGANFQEGDLVQLY